MCRILNFFFSLVRSNGPKWILIVSVCQKSARNKFTNEKVFDDDDLTSTVCCPFEAMNVKRAFKANSFEAEKRKFNHIEFNKLTRREVYAG